MSYVVSMEARGEGGGVRERWEELWEERRLPTEGVEEREEGTALTWVTGWTHDVVWVSWLGGRHRHMYV